MPRLAYQARHYAFRNVQHEEAEHCVVEAVESAASASA